MMNLMISLKEIITGNTLGIYKYLIGGVGDLGLSYRRVCKLLGSPQSCALCGYVFEEELKKPTPSGVAVPHQPTIDHIIPRSRGGTSEASNLQWACFVCNQDKGDK